jgi:hypothetical protein
MEDKAAPDPLSAGLFAEGTAAELPAAEPHAEIRMISSRTAMNDEAFFFISDITP